MLDNQPITWATAGLHWLEKFGRSRAHLLALALFALCAIFSINGARARPGQNPVLALQFHKNCASLLQLYMWNNLNDSLKNINLFSTFKKVITSRFALPVVPAYYLYGNSFLSVLHAWIRNKCSGLNGDLFHNYLHNSQLFICLVEPEDADHYLCPCIERSGAYCLTIVCLFVRPSILPSTRLSAPS